MHRALALVVLWSSVAAVAQEPAPARVAAPVCEELPYAHPVREDLAVPPGLEVPWFYEYDPPPTLVAPEHPTPRARYPFVDVHNHQGRMAEYGEEQWGELLAAMDGMNMAVLVNLSGRGFRRVEQPDGSVRFGLGGTDELRRAVERAEEVAPGRFVVFTNLDTSELGAPGWTEGALAQLEADVAAGARGLKIYKSLGMGATDAGGARIAVDDPRLDPIWERCGELGIPVLIHSADPAPFWQPRTAENERLLELMERPGRYQGDGENPPFEEILDEQHAVFRKHPGTTFIDAHLGWLGHDLARLGRLLDELPNVHTEIGAVLAELGRQPRAAREFLIRYQDRVLFGKDSWNPEEYPVYFRVLETADEYFDYYRPRHAFWKMYGLAVPDEVLRKLYYGNALRIVPGLDASLFPPVGAVEAEAPPELPATDLLPNGRAPLPGVVTGGQPEAAQLAALAEAGFRTVVDLRTPGEDYPRQEEISTLDSLGLDYVSIPVAGAEGLTEENARALSRVLADEAAYPVAIHCGSGNRVGALLALEAAWIDGRPPEEALALGRSGGLTRLEAEVRELLGLDEEDP